MKTLKTAEEFRNAAPGSYIVEGEATAELARQVVVQVEKKYYRRQRDAMLALQRFARYGSHRSKVRAKKLLHHPTYNAEEALYAFKNSG